MIVWLATLLITILITIVATEPLQYFLARAISNSLPFPRAPRSVAGIWLSVYFYESKGKNITESHLTELRQFGKYVIGHSLHAQNHWHTMRGRLEHEMYLTGIWENTSHGDVYHGAFQFSVHPNGKEMNGKWLGYDRQQRIQHGVWTWRFIDAKSDSSTKKHLLRKYSNGAFASLLGEMVRHLEDLEKEFPK